MAEFKLDRFKYRWRGNWGVTTEYRRDDVVRLNGKSWVCLVAHTSTSDFDSAVNAVVPGSNPPVPNPYWVEMTSSKLFVGDWTDGQLYFPGDVVLKDGSLFEAVTAHTATTFAADFENWKVFANHIAFLGNWTTATEYGPGAVVSYGGNSYRCVTPHTSGSLLEDDRSKWEVFLDGIAYKGEWSQSTDYKLNDLVKYGASVYKAIEGHNSGSKFNTQNWTLHLEGYKFEGEWGASVTYVVGDIVKYSGILWVAVKESTGLTPAVTNLIPEDDTWKILLDSYDFAGQYVQGNNFKPGDIVQAGGNLYVAQEEIGGTADDGSSLDFLDLGRWEKLKEGFRWRGKWSNSDTYFLNDVVEYFGSAYICNTQHVAEDNNFPGDNGSGFEYWDSLIQSPTDIGMNSKGELLSYGLERSNVGDNSTVGNIGFPIGNEEQLLSVENNDLFWRNYINDSDVIYVSSTGVDDDEYGTSIYKPFRSVRYALEYVEDNFDSLTPVTVKVATGRYSEICPMSVPAGCVVFGNELRATTIEANSPLEQYQNEYNEAHLIWIDHFLSYIDNIFNRVEFDTSEGNALFPEFGESVTGVNPGITIANLVTDYKNYIEFRIESGDTNPVLTSTNIRTSNSDTLTAIEILEQNKQFIFEESFAFLTETVTDITHDRAKIRSDVYSLIRALKYDLEYPGNYKTLLAARRYSNAVTGSQLDDMFYFRDTTGIRNCTLEGLRGTLNPPGTFELFQRPTGKSFCSLDPGWGPADERVWINNRSPYLQGVTNIGTSCIGQKIDGSLHNGGNKSMVSNDFTQVLSDGIGAWILNNGRAELVSVFTYYCSIGYFAEDGGIIRATNGNNSYGRFGAIADGNDPNETPQTVQVFNRNNQAIVGSAFSGDLTDEIFIFEYDHCGEEYSQVQAEVIGAGGGAEVEYDEFRDGAIFQLRLINPEGSGLAGGAGYNVYGGSPTVGDETTITLEVGTELLEEDIIGMRIILVSGEATGQYGYIDSYTSASRIAQINKETTDEPGWDHLIPGTPIETSLSSNTQYRIEPRVTATAPGFTTSNYDLSAVTEIVDSTYGDTSGEYNNILVAIGSGETDQSVTETAATFNIIRTGTQYSVNLADGGAGYAVGDQLTISGGNIGGTTPANDITITVTSTTDDSTNSIVGFTSEGTGIGGVFVAISNPNFAQYSADGETWTQVNLPNVAEWKRVYAANGVFLAIAFNSDSIAYSTTGSSWESYFLPSQEDWSDIAYGNGRFVIVAENTNTIATSTDGITWTQATIPDDIDGDSTASQWQSVAYGQGKFVAISGSTGETATSLDGVSWTRSDNSFKLPFLTSKDWVKLVYGNNRFLAISRDGNTVFSLDGDVWYEGEILPAPGGVTSMNWQDLDYFQGVFIAVCTRPGPTIAVGESETSFCVTSEDGLVWIERDLLNSSLWKTVTHASLNNVPTFVALSTLASTSAVTKVFTGARLKLRADVSSRQIRSLRIIDPGSGYTSENLPEITITENSAGTEVAFQIRRGNGVLPQPSFVNRGTGYRPSSTTVNFVGDGYADIIPEGTTLTVSGVTTVPGPGAQIRISGIFDEDTIQEDDLLLFRAVTVEDLGDDGTGANTKLVRFRITPSLKIEYNLNHNTSATIRERFSQCRISGHDFLDIGTGNFEETNYPEIYASGNFFVAAPENEVREDDGGRVFYTSTDQDGNFRAGELFGVEQATGIVTISADFFELDGLSELALGGVRLGGSGTVVREFSTDPNFTEDSNNVVPTQRAIAAFISNRLSQGGSAIELNALTSGFVTLGGENNSIGTVADSISLEIPVVAEIQGSQAGLSGFILAQQMAMRIAPFDEGMQ